MQAARMAVMVFALTLVGSVTGAELDISFQEAQAALESAHGSAAVNECAASDFVRVGTSSAEAMAYFTLVCRESTDNWTANVNLNTGFTTWTRCAMFRMLAPGVGPQCLDKLPDWD